MRLLFKVSLLLLLQNVWTASLSKRATVPCNLPLSMQGRCQCQYGVVKCEDLDRIVGATAPSTAFRLEVYDSNLTTNGITVHSFDNWAFKEIIIERCNLTDSSFDANSFAGLETTLLQLSLANNELTMLPTAISKFTKINDLDVSGNPIDENSFQENVLRDIGDTLRTFTFGTKIGGTALKQWPTTLLHLQNLQELNLTASDMTIFPTRAFHGFEGTLRRLIISHTNLRSVPLAISRVRYLEELYFDHNTNVGDYGLKIPLIKGFLPYLVQMSLKDDNITTFPEVLQSFNKLKDLNMDENDLKFVSDLSAKSVSQISSLSLQNSGITRIPGAIQDIAHLNTLDLSNNSIHAIETNDLKESNELLTLRLNNNPILYISQNAFANQKVIRRIELKNVQISRVPCALESLIRNHSGSYVIIDLSGNTIECNCGLRWLFDVKNSSGVNTRFRLIGNCDTISSTLQDYVNGQLAVCPQGIGCSDSD